MEKHFKLTDETINHDGHTLHRIQATRDLPKHNVKMGDLGGYVEYEDNLQDEAWIFDNAKAYERSVVSGRAVLRCAARAFGWARIYENAIVGDRALVYNEAEVCGNAVINDCVEIYGRARICGNIQIYGLARIFE
jgi:UDP-3-O-[3-hydroxymyristoyl] glucosamine N-acyltransferase